MSPLWIYIGLVVSFDLIANVAAKYWSLTGKDWLLGIVILAFGFVGYFYAQTLKYEGIAIANMLWVSFATLGISALGYFWFKEDINTFQWIGICFIGIGLMLVNIETS
jgi:multidrug transporter EmrE-like cation transporter